MKNEVMAATITGIDDKLITEAQVIPKRSNKLRPVYGIAALAACLVLVFTFIFSVGNHQSANFGQPELLLDGNIKIGQEPVTVEIPIIDKARSSDIVTAISFSLDIKEPTTISVSKGTMNIGEFRDPTNYYYSDTLYYTGTKYTTEIPVNIYWIIDGSDIGSDYTLTLNDGELVYSLSYNESDSYWSICKR